MSEVRTFIQWKGTDVCIDVTCSCGARGHADGYGAHYVRCPECGAVYALPTHLELRLVQMGEIPHVPPLALALDSEDDGDLLEFYAGDHE